MAGKCLYPNKIWYNQHNAVFVNLTLDKVFNVSEVFNIKYGHDYTTDLPPLKSVWMKRWSIHSIYYRVMDESLMSNNVIIVVDRKLPTVQPDTIITNIRKMIGQSWSTRIRNVTKVWKSSLFSTLTTLWIDPYTNTFNNITEQAYMPRYEMIYVRQTLSTITQIVTRLYICEQVELAPSEFVLSKRKNILYSYMNNRFMFDGQFVLTYSGTRGESRARICIDDSGLLKSNGDTVNNVATFYKAFGHCLIVANILLILVHHLIS
jgi:hypothetical protein